MDETLVEEPATTIVADPDADESRKSNVSEGMCRICFSEETDPKSNPLISPCKCSGSMGMIHLDCLR